MSEMRCSAFDDHRILDHNVNRPCVSVTSEGIHGLTHTCSACFAEVGACASAWRRARSRRASPCAAAPRIDRFYMSIYLYISVSLSLSLYIYIYILMYTYIYIYIYDYLYAQEALTGAARPLLPLHDPRGARN